MNTLCKSDLNTPFKTAQTLYQSYSTLQTNHTLESIFFDTFASLGLPITETDNIRESFNNIILKYYPNELSIKSSFINQVLFKSSNHVSIFELPIGNSRVDLCKIDGSSVAFEIKTDLDNLSRLDKQLSDYLEVFEEVFIICSSNKVQEIERKAVSNCGIYTYSISKHGNYKFVLYKQATRSQNLNAAKQLNVLRKQELVDFFSITWQRNRDDMISLILSEYSPTQVNNLFKCAIKSRYQSQWDFLKNHSLEIFEIDYQWFFKNTVSPELIYG